MKKYLAFTITVISLMTLGSCSGKKDIRDYYYPLKALKEMPKVYEYDYRLKDTTLKMYWYYQTIIQNDSIYFVGTCYNDEFQQLLLTREQQFANGMKLKDLFYFGTDSSGSSVRSRATIEGGAVFPFQVTDDKGIFINIIKYKDPKDSTIETTLTRNRRFVGSASYSYKNEQHDAIELEMKEEQSVSDPRKGGLSHIYTIQEIYAKDIGLVFTKREISEGQFLEMHLVDVYPMQDFETKFRDKQAKGSSQ